MHLFFFDTETTGLVRKGVDISKQPYVVEFAGILYNFEAGKEPEKIEELHWYIKPPISIPKICSDIHGVTDERVKSCYTFLEYAEEILENLINCDYIVGHNVSFDMNVLYYEFIRTFETRQEALELVEMKNKILCTMMTTTQLCKLPSNRGGYKWPKLTELHSHLFGMEFSNAHNALADIEATAKCFIELVKKGHVEFSEDISNLYK